ncbi:hypothetical protein TNCV_4628721 [Trichonephila clavipes]|nr:hypothetical protein TNCV_4628721 [Trichonephila clavipes]
MPNNRDSQPIVYFASYSENSNTDVLSIVSSPTQKIEALTTQVNRLSRERDRQNAPNSRKRSLSCTFNNDNRNPVYCRYHNQFGRKPVNVLDHVRLIKIKLEFAATPNQIAGNCVATKTSNRLHLYDAGTKMKFLVDTHR